ncbi:MAG TPA: cupin domain-containing protein [Pseudonocardiaceae bacterium]
MDVARWEQYSLGGALPFQAMWYTVAPNSFSGRDQHPERELSVVISGTASIETVADGRITDIPAGDCFLFESREAHVIHNRTDEPLVVFSAYWMPQAADAAHAVGVTEEAAAAVAAAGAGAAAESGAESGAEAPGPSGHDRDQEPRPAEAAL